MQEILLQTTLFSHTITKIMTFSFSYYWKLSKRSSATILTWFKNSSHLWPISNSCRNSPKTKLKPKLRTWIPTTFIYVSLMKHCYCLIVIWTFFFLYSKIFSFKTCNFTVCTIFWDTSQGAYRRGIFLQSMTKCNICSIRTLFELNK